MGIIQEPTLQTYFSRRRIISAPRCGGVVSRERFKPVMKFIHFVDNANREIYEGPAELYKILPVLLRLNYKFQNLFLPWKNISVNKSLTLWKGCLFFKQYLLQISAKFGIKIMNYADPFLIFMVSCGIHG
jgi:hypothetical protein